MIWLIVVGFIILYLLVGFACHVIFTLWNPTNYSYDLPAGFTTLLWPLGVPVILMVHASNVLDRATTRIYRYARDKRRKKHD